MSEGENGEFQVFHSSGGAEIYRIPLRVFPNMIGYAYLVQVDGDDEGGPYRVLIDTGSGFGESNPNLETGLCQVGEIIGHPCDLGLLTHVLITHGHIDHFGGVGYVRERTNARLGVHELDLRNLTNYEERLSVASRRVNTFIIEAGVGDNDRQHLLNMYLLTKNLHRSVRVDFTYEAIGMRLGPFEFLHVPGHCAGHVVIRLHDVLFSGDHVLEEISPHQSPEHLTLSTGLEHYLRSLDALKAWAGNDIRLTLGGHRAPITDLPGRIDAIRQVHRQRLDQVLALLREPKTVKEVAEAMFGDVHGYNTLLALEEAGAHVEYLYQRGMLGVDNLAELEAASGPISTRYRCLI